MAAPHYSTNIAPPGVYMLFVLRDKIHSISGEVHAIRSPPVQVKAH